MIIDIVNLSKIYPQVQGRNQEKIEVLKNLNLKIENKERLAILGHSGSGKTTLLSILAGLERPTSGEINILGENMGKLSERELTRFRSKHIGIVFQQYHLMDHLTAFENILLPLEIQAKSNEQEVYEVLREVGLYSFDSKNAQLNRDKHFPFQLSGGECQRVALARAVIAHPHIILADEPSGNLDKETGKKVMDLLFSLVKKHSTTLILVTHNEELAHRCDRVLHLDGGAFI